MNILINQPAGLGDILFCQKIAKSLVNEGHSVYWPVDQELSYISDYLDSPGVIYDSPKASIDKVIDLANADRTIMGSVLKAKYSLVGIDYADWSDFLSIKRNFSKEKSLVNLLDLNEKFTLISSFYGTPPNHISKDLPAGKYDSVSIRLIDGFTPFDWSSIFEMASEIIMVDTSFNYIMETLNIKAESLKLFSRFQTPNFTHIDGIFNLPWEKHI